MTRLNHTIPNNIKRLLWEVKGDSLDTDKNKRLIIERVLNYGSLGDWRWLRSQYGQPEIAASLAKQTRDNLRSESRQLATLLLK